MTLAENINISGDIDEMERKIKETPKLHWHNDSQLREAFI